MNLKHNGQTKVCNLCLESDHIRRNCPNYKCKVCDVQGHREANCPKVRCFKCQELGHKSFNCPETFEEYRHDNTDAGSTLDTHENETQYQSEGLVTGSVEQDDHAIQEANEVRAQKSEQNTDSTAKKNNNANSRHPSNPNQESKKTHQQQRTEQKTTLPTQKVVEQRRTQPETGSQRMEGASTQRGNIQPHKRQISLDEDGFQTIRLKKKTFIPNLSRARNVRTKDSSAEPMQR